MSALSPSRSRNRAKIPQCSVPPAVDQPTTKATCDTWEFELDEYLRKNPHIVLPAGKVIGGCRVTGLIRQSNVRIGLKAEQINLENRLVAINLLHPDLAGDRKMQLAFQEEAAIAARLHHPAFPAVYDAELYCAHPFYITEYVHGMDLVQQVRENGPLSLHQAIPMVRQTAQALRYAFECGVIHRGLQPSSLLLLESSSDSYWSIKLLDCGASDADPYEHRSSRDLCGLTCGPQEQSIGPRTNDTRADMRSLGTVLHFLLTGEFANRRPATTTQEQCAASMIAENSLRADPEAEIPPAVCDLIYRLLAPESCDPFQTLDDLLEELDRTVPVCQ